MIGYQFKQGSDGQWYVTLVSLGNHATLMTSEGYTERGSAEHMVEILKKGGLDIVPVDDDPTVAEKTEHVEEAGEDGE